MSFKKMSVVQLRERVKFFDSYCRVIENRKFPIEKCCLCGSVTLTAMGLRKNNDVEFVCTADVAKKKGFKLDSTYFFDDKRVSMFPVSPDFFPNAIAGMPFLEGHHIEVDGFKIATLEDYYMHKCMFIFDRLKKKDASKKDAEDIKMMNQYFRDNGFDSRVIPENVWDGGEVWEIGGVPVRLPSPFRLEKYDPRKAFENGTACCNKAFW